MTRHSRTGEKLNDAVGEPSRRGRRRDPEVDSRILEVAKLVYAERGWAGFNFDVVARRANVSKDSMYRRYESKIDLLLATLKGNADPQVMSPSHDDLRRHLIAVAKDHFRIYTESSGLISLRIFIEATENPELAKAYHQQLVSPVIENLRAEVRSAIESGQLPDVSSPTAMIDALLGGVVMHVLATPPERRAEIAGRIDEYAVDLVDLLLRGCGYTRRAD